MILRIQMREQFGPCHLVKGIGFVLQTTGTGGDTGLGLGKVLAQDRQDGHAQAAADELRPGIGRVFDKGQTVVAGMVLQHASGDIQQGSPQPTRIVTTQRSQGSHGRKTFLPGPVHKPQQHGFHLVITVMGQGQDAGCGDMLGKGGTTSAAGSGFHAFLGDRVHRYLRALEFHTQMFGKCARLFGPGRGLRLQAVVHMQGRQAACPGRRDLRQDMQQHGGIKASAEADPDGSGRKPTQGIGQRACQRFQTSVCQCPSRRISSPAKRRL